MPRAWRVCRSALERNSAARLVGRGTTAGIHRSRSAQSQDRGASDRADLRQSRTLAGYSPRNGARVWPQSKDCFFHAMRDTAADAKIKWEQNALRHSFISYRLAEVQDVNCVALEAGNSPQIIFRYYRELATPDQARTWFSIAPATSDKVIAISAGRKR